jgi:hypothetical protein
MRHQEIKMPSGSIIRVEHDRIVDITRQRENAILANLVLSLALATAIGFVAGVAFLAW